MKARTPVEGPVISYPPEAVLEIEHVAAWLRVNVASALAIGLPVVGLGARSKRYLAGGVLAFIGKRIGRDAAAWLRDSDSLTIRATLARPPFRLAGFATNIYVIRCADTGNVKIGVSKKVPARLAQLQRAHGSRLDLVLSVPGTRMDEQETHERFTAHRVRGEWFREAPEITRWIEGLANG